MNAPTIATLAVMTMRSRQTPLRFLRKPFSSPSISGTLGRTRRTAGVCLPYDRLSTPKFAGWRRKRAKSEEAPGLAGKTLGVAVVGGGAHRHAAGEHGDAPSLGRFLAVSDVDEGRATTLANNVKADFASGDNLNVIAHPRSTPSSSRRRSMRTLKPIFQALELGKPVFVEKPIALTIEDADDHRGGRAHGRRTRRRLLAAARPAVAVGARAGRAGARRRHPRHHGPRLQHPRPDARDPQAHARSHAGARRADLLRRHGVLVHGRRQAGRGGRPGQRTHLPGDGLLGARRDLRDHHLRERRAGEPRHLLRSAGALPDVRPELALRDPGHGRRHPARQDHKDSILFTDKGVPHAYVPDHEVNMLSCRPTRPATGRWATTGAIANETRAWLDHLLTGRPCSHTTAVAGRRTLEVTLAIEASARSGIPVQLSGR